MQTFATGRGRLAVEVHGDGPEVVLLHGTPGGPRSWDAVVPRLVAAGHRVLVPHLLGFGASERLRGERVQAHAQAEAVAFALDRLAVDRPVLVGHDFGVPVALLLHAADPGRAGGVALLAGCVLPDTPVPFPVSTVGWPVVGAVARQVLFSRTAQRGMALAGGRGAPVDLGDRRQSGAVADVLAASLADLPGRYAPVRDAAAALDVPVHVAWGDRDPFFPLAEGERVAALVGTPLRVHRGAGHFLPQERPADVAADVAALAGSRV